MSWQGISAQQIPYYWERLESKLKLIELHDVTPGQIYYHLREQNLQLWVWKDFEFILITEILHHPNVSVLALKWGAGKFSRAALKQGRAIVIPWAKSYGCEQVEVAGRPGWKRILGLKPLVTIYRGDI